MSLTRSLIDGWQTQHLADTADWLRTQSTESRRLFDEFHQSVKSAGWTGDAKDAAVDMVGADVSVVDRQGAVAREAADIAGQGAVDVQAAKRDVLSAISDAESDGFTVAEDLSVTDTRRVDLLEIRSRHMAMTAHAEAIRWRGEQLVQADALVGRRLAEKAAELDGIRFEGGGTVQAASFGDGFKQWPVLDHDKPWEYNLDLTTTFKRDDDFPTSAGTIASIDDVWKELNRCFNCNFPMGGAPAKLPTVGDRLPLEIEVADQHLLDFPVEVTQVSKTASEINIEFATLPGHVDGEGSTIHFRFYESGGELHLGIRGYIEHGPGTDEGLPGAPVRWGYTKVAEQTWQPYIDRLVGNIAHAEGVPVVGVKS
ncbi:hypothetical protein [Mycolicibacterium farcinogenes]|uniref:hypothetical protein n=1 Tax=Mycolicibacterium farcinogenes TaxID=1802 RepID=UPI0021AD5727|nr:hypothetical protein [Mycolicibacterium farcinogenes]